MLDGEVASTTWFGQPSSVPGWTVEELFDRIGVTIDEGRRVAVSYDAATGIPVDVQLDLDAIPVDGGLSLVVRDVVFTDQLREDLATARAAWAGAELDDYDLVYQVVCFCPQTTVRSEVRAGEAMNVEVESDFAFEAALVTVDDLFAEIEQALDDGVFSIAVEYDADLGYPTQYFIDVIEFLADEEFGVGSVGVTPR